MANFDALKAVAFQKLLESGLLERDGEEERKQFEAYWSAFERNVRTVVQNELSQKSSCDCPDERGNDGDCSVDDSVYSRILSLLFSLHYLLPFAAGFIFALFLVIR